MPLNANHRLLGLRTAKLTVEGIYKFIWILRNYHLVILVYWVTRPFVRTYLSPIPKSKLMLSLISAQLQILFTEVHSSQNPRLSYSDSQENSIQIPEFHSAVQPMQSVCQGPKTEISHKPRNPTVSILLRAI